MKINFRILQLNFNLALPVKIFQLKGEGILRENLGAPLKYKK